MILGSRQIIYMGINYHVLPMPTIDQPNNLKFQQSRPLEYLPIIDPQLDVEFQAWDTLSDEALMNFERELD